MYAHIFHYLLSWHMAQLLEGTYVVLLVLYCNTNDIVSLSNMSTRSTFLCRLRRIRQWISDHFLGIDLARSSVQPDFLEACGRTYYWHIVYNSESDKKGWFIFYSLLMEPLWISINYILITRQLQVDKCNW